MKHGLGIDKPTLFQHYNKLDAKKPSRLEKAFIPTFRNF